MNQRTARQKVLFLIKIGLVLAILFFIGRQAAVNWEKAKSFTWDPHWGYLALSFVVLFSFNFPRGWVWGLIVRLVDPDISLKKSTWIWIMSSYGRYIPGKVWLFLGKIYLSMQEGVTRKNASVAVMLEFVITMLSAFLFSFLFLPFMPQLNAYVSLWWYALIIPGGLLLLHSKSMNLIIQLLARLTRREAGPVVYPYWRVLVTFLVFCAIWFWYVFGIFLFYRAVGGLGFNHFWFFCCLIPLSRVIGLIAIFAPDGLGVREGILSFGLKSILPVSIGVILAAVERLWAMAIDLATLGLLLVVKRKNIRDIMMPGKDAVTGSADADRA